ncbi:hypothetical protein [Haloferax sp. DFSO60]|uniref:hypothetical protein n=1 Tax=Haloferax sp. DFSO60 TaxID=3388652 RepID=UPI00397B1602
MSLLTTGATFASILSAVVAGSFLHPVVTGGTTSTAGTEYVAIAAAFVLLALTFGVLRVSMFGDSSIRSLLDAAPSMLKVGARKAGALTLAGVLVTTAATSGVVPNSSPVGTASAEWSEDCDLRDSALVAFTLSIVDPNGDGCRWFPGETADYENMSEVDAYASTLGVKDNTETFLTTNENFMQDTRSVAWSKAKLTIINELNNGSSLSQVKAAANQTVLDYYAGIEYNVMSDYSAKVSQMRYIDQETPLSVQWYDPTDDRAETGSWVVDKFNYTTMNGTDIPYDSFQGSVDNNWLSWHQSSGKDPYYVEVQDPDTSNWVTIYDTADYRSVRGGLYNQKDQVQSNVDAYVDALAAQYTAGDINSSDIVNLDPSILAEQAATDYNSTGYYSFAAVQLAALGASGDLNASHTVTVHGAVNTTWNGTLFYTGDDGPTSGWETGTTYNISDYNGTFYLAYQNDNQSGITDLSSSGTSFTIESAVNTNTGEEMNTTISQTYIYKSTNASALQEEIDRLQQLREQYESTNTGGAGSSGGLSTEIIGGAVLVGVAAVLLIQREGNK